MRAYIVKTTAQRFRKGDRIAWARDHVSERVRVGSVADQHGKRIYAWPDDRNNGPEVNGGNSEIDIADVLGFVIER